MSSLLVASCLALPAASAGSTPIPPSQDPFYSAPPDFASAAPGTVLRSRPAPGNLTSLFNQSALAYNIVFRTTNSLYQPMWALTTLFIPSAASNATNNSLLSYQIPYNTNDVDGSPSYLFYFGWASGLILSDINTALSWGWYVNVPDFEGPLASFGASVLEGHATLDSVRAALSFVHGPGPLARCAMWGYSGGSIASEWAAELQVQYAPELDFAGVAVGGLVPDYANTLTTIDGTPAAGLLPSALLGVTDQYPDAYDFLLSKLRTSGPYNSTGFLAARNMSYFQAAETYAGQTILEDYFTTGNATINEPVLRKVFENDGLMGYHGIPQMPMFIYKAIQDEYSHVQDTDDLVARYCLVGARILYQRNTAGWHLDEETNGDAAALDWLRSVLEGTNSLDGCTIQNVTVNISSSGPFPPPA